jgi:hypothetical protein
MDHCGSARRVAEWNPQGERSRNRPISTWKDGIGDSVQRRNLKNEELRRKNIVFGLRKAVRSQKISYSGVFAQNKNCRDIETAVAR